ncbi:MAG: hypothetical protein KAU36_08810 [candidate division Zixibacteria bacterium]|nr:hypothetical protein [candidate division Zixibacteria bacterium]
MKKIVLFSLAFSALGTSQAWAANFAVITSPPTLLHFFILAAAVGCLIGSFKVLSLVKGGQLSKSWQIFMLGFIVLALCQLAILFRDFEIVGLPVFVIPAMLFLMSGLFLYGVFEAGRTLS